MSNATPPRDHDQAEANLREYLDGDSVAFVCATVQESGRLFVHDSVDPETFDDEELADVYDTMMKALVNPGDAFDEVPDVIEENTDIGDGD